MPRYMRPCFAVRGALVTLALAVGGIAMANPYAPTTVSGQAAFSASGGLLTVTNSPGAIINWQSFSIGRDEATRFVQQSATSSVLNRVTGANPSEILGRLSSNGRVFLINPSGIAFGAGAVIDVAGLVASSLALGDADFAAGRLRFSGSGREAAVRNAGDITTPAGGMVALVGPQAINSGLIRAPSGDVMLAAGSTVQFVDLRYPYIQIEIGAPADAARPLPRLDAAAVYSYLVRQSGVISTSGDTSLAGGRITLRSAQALQLDAGSLTDAGGLKGGTVDLGAAASVVLSGAIEATGAAGPGGTVRAGAAALSLSAAARIDVSGAAGGGSVLAGASPDLPATEAISVAPGASILANALESGTGGSVGLSAAQRTAFLGRIEARGGPHAGDGGQVEISAGDAILIRGTVDTLAPAGADGRLLIDPARIDIVAGSTGLPGALADGLWTDAENPGAQALGATDLGALLATTSVTLQATQAISLAPDAAITVALAAPRSLTLSAPNIELRGQIGATGAPLSLALDAAGGTVHVADKAAIALEGGTLSIRARSVSSTETRAIESSERQMLERVLPDAPSLRAQVEAEIARDNARLATTLRACARSTDIRQGCAVGAPRRFQFAGV